MYFAFICRRTLIRLEKLVLHRVMGPLRDLEIIGAFVMDKGFIPSLNASYVKNGGFIHDRKEMSSESKRLQGYNY